MRSRWRVIAIVLLMLAMGLAACGASSETETPAAQSLAAVTDTPAEPPTTGAPPVATKVLPTDTATALPATDTPAPPQVIEVPPTVAEVPPTEIPTPPPPTDTPVPTEPAVVATMGQTEDGLYFRGSPDASVTVIDYSDFL